MIDILSLIGNYAFPIIMCLWFMFRTEKVIEANTAAINQLQGSTQALGTMLIARKKE